ncbi:dihydrolipoyllysine-residue acetyltransferase component 5 of pyruvate dehydrogenase complex, chloroplastic [Beta vulgaris subsp. vulgaris]|uniref:dihydrolipoyllysine-residue acetyltransferase component 5 of pyruvate dehydrogenase complex, chloroplastic n=1 Tax=Beta vulgaris subsp. vulgaris TaxID=3555 RepID=UPI002037657F|nr:dihydrolipoyllysine-residue acetyltransferase component 5 of pyruvate dehydrogenase complex, chloroplastic [Beta vulgaris subsp. vulgaris]
MANILNLKSTTFLPSSHSLRFTQKLHTTRSTIRIRAKIREIFMPALSSTMTEGKIVSWIKSEGDKLSKGDSVVVVESDKADMDVETFYDGYLAKIIVDEGSVAPVGSAIALLAESEAEISDAIAKAMENPKHKPSGSESVASNVASGVASDVAAPVVVAVKEGGLSVSDHPAAEGGKRVVASPYAKKLGKELGVDLRNVVGSGPQGRIVAKDVEAAAAAAAVEVAEVVVSKDIPVSKTVELGKTVPFTTMQNAVSRNMVESLGVPTFRVGYTITSDALDALYKKVKSKGVTMTALLAKATALALVKHPVVNSSCRDGKSFTYNSRINIAVAVAMDGGLLTPVLQDADKVDIYTLSRKWKELVDKARAKQLQPQEYSTGTFTLSNLGMFGVDRFDAILPPGTGAIMAVGASQPNVVASKDGRIGMKNQMQVNVTADHRVIYGADLAAFLQTLAQIIEDPKDMTL